MCDHLFLDLLANAHTVRQGPVSTNSWVRYFFSKWSKFM